MPIPLGSASSVTCSSKMLPTRQMSPRVPAFPFRFEMYSLETHGSMMADRVRLTAYGEALRGAVRPGAVVADIGCGGGIFLLLAFPPGGRRGFSHGNPSHFSGGRRAGEDQWVFEPTRFF